MDNLELLTKLIEAEDEKVIDKIISDHPVLSKEKTGRFNSLSII